jgi:hypothetical protein
VVRDVMDHLDLQGMPLAAALGFPLEDPTPMKGLPHRQKGWKEGPADQERIGLRVLPMSL